MTETKRLPAYQAVIDQHLPALEIVSLRVNDEGLVNDVVILNEEWVFRFPKGDGWQRDLQANEIKVLDLVRRHTTMRVPNFEIRAEDFVAYKLIPGQPLLRNTIFAAPENVQDRLAEQLGMFLYKFHNIPKADLHRANIAQSDTNRDRAVFLKLYQDVQDELFPIMLDHTKEWVHQHFKPVLEDEDFLTYEPALINGDLAPYHILYDAEVQEMAGMIDFGTAGIGDPAVDFCCIIDNYGESFLWRLGKVYPNIEQFVDRARFWAGTMPLQWALTGQRSGDLSWFTVQITGARDVLPVGRPWPKSM